MLDFNYLWKGNWLSVISPKDKNYEYEVIHEDNGVFILPYLINEECFIIRKEFCPPYFVKDKMIQLYYTLISGGIKKGESSDDAVFRELEEETGIFNPDVEWFEISNCLPIFKSSDYRSTLFILGIVEYDQIKPYGDGTKDEDLSKSVKVTFEELTNIIENEKNYDYLLYGIYYKLKDLLKEKIDNFNYLKEEL